MSERLTPAAVRALTDADLDRRVAEAMGIPAWDGNGCRPNVAHTDKDGAPVTWCDTGGFLRLWRPSADWRDAGEAMEWMAGKGWLPLVEHCALGWCCATADDGWPPIAATTGPRAISEALVLAADAAKGWRPSPVRIANADDAGATH